MDWIVTGLISAFLFAVVTVSDKRLLAVYMPSVRSFYFLVGFCQIMLGVVISIFSPWSSSPSFSGILIGISSGASWGCGLALMFYGISKLEVSKVMPIAHTYPVFVTIMAIAFLGDNISLIQSAGILITVLGASIIAASQTKGVKKSAASFVYFLVLLGSILTAVANISYKAGLEEMGFWDLFAIRSVFQGLVLMIVGCHFGIIREVKTVIRSKAGLGLFIFSEGLTAPIAIMVMLTALSLGPVALASTIVSTRPLFVLFISGLLSISYLRLLDEPFTKRTFPIKLLSILLIFFGVALLTIGST